MKLRIQAAIEQIAGEARIRYSDLLRGARQTTEEAARRVSKGKGPLQAVTSLGLNLTAVGHKTADKALKQNKKFISNRMDAVAGRLRSAAHADGLRDLVATQLRLIPKNASQFADDARGALHILAEAGGDVRQLLTGTIQELRGTTPAAKKRSAKKSAPKAAAAGKRKAKQASKPKTAETAKAA